MTVHLVRWADAPAQPWRNGGGTTRELLAWPALAAAPPGPAGDSSVRSSGSAMPWQLRVSVADITRDGPFSAFPGVGRAFAVLEGPGVVLDFATAPDAGMPPGAHPAGTMRLTPADAAITFDGAQAPGCQLIDGPTRDLNLMVLESAGRPVMARAAAGQSWAPGGRWRGLYTHGSACLETAAGRLELPPACLAWTEETTASPWRLFAGEHCWWLALEDL
jgi:environmental stress-induced protein Ves